MSLQEIALPAMIIADLYKKSLVELHTGKDQKIANKEVQSNRGGVRFLGKNSRNVLIFVEYPGVEFLPAEELDFLITILKACQLNIDDIAIINLAQAHPDFGDIIKELRPSNILLFGIDPSLTPLISQTTHFTISLYEEAHVVTAPELRTLNQKTSDSRVLKTQLWNNLKQLFNV